MDTVKTNTRLDTAVVIRHMQRDFAASIVMVSFLANAAVFIGWLAVTLS